jgi:hypothetical protein
MYSGDGRFADSSRERKVGIDMGGRGREARIGENRSRISRVSLRLSCGTGLDDPSLWSRLSGVGACLLERRSSPSCPCACVRVLEEDCLLRTIDGDVMDRELSRGRPCLNSVACVLTTTTSVSCFASRLRDVVLLLSPLSVTFASTGLSKTTPSTLLSSSPSACSPGVSPSHTSSSIGVAARMGILVGSLVSS